MQFPAQSLSLPQSPPAGAADPLPGCYPQDLLRVPAVYQTRQTRLVAAAPAPMVQPLIPVAADCFQAGVYPDHLLFQQGQILLPGADSVQALSGRDLIRVRQFHPPVFRQARVVVRCSPDLPRLGQAPVQSPLVVCERLADRKCRIAHQQH